MATLNSYPEPLSEAWLLERTYHARLQNGQELSVFDFTEAMKTIIDCYVPVSTWRQLSREEAHVTYQQGNPVLLFGENTWQNPLGAIGTDYAVRYLDPKRGSFSNAFWQMWFASDSGTTFDGSDLSAITFFGPCMQFPYTTHYTVIAPDGQVYEYVDRAQAAQGFTTFSAQEGNNESHAQTAVFTQCCYYHEMRCPSGIYRLAFFGSGMNKPGYKVTNESLSPQAVRL
jgi:hypothetical protein